MAARPPSPLLDNSSDTNNHIPSPNTAGSMAGTAPDPEASTAPSRPSVADPMRAYRACLNCRGRKSKCDLDFNNGRPVSLSYPHISLGLMRLLTTGQPCRRCQREARECILGESHRGGRRVRKKPKIEDNPQSSSPASSQTPTLTTPNAQAPRSQPFHSSYDGPQSPGVTWHTPVSATATGSESVSRQSGPRNHEDIASADLQNPSDALEILAQVADRADDGESLEGEQQGSRMKIQRPVLGTQDLGPPKMDDRQLYYKPVLDGLIAPEMVYHLFSRYVLLENQIISADIK